MNKKGSEITIGTIIIIILALVVLVVVIYGFTTGWSGLWSNIVNFVGGGNNVETVVKACTVACTTQSTYDYCSKDRSISFEVADSNGKKTLTTVTTNCNDLAKHTPTTDKNGKPVTLPPVDLSCAIDCSTVGAPLGK